MSDTTVKFNFGNNVDTRPSTDPDAIIDEYLKYLDDILTEDEEYSTIVYNNYVRKGEEYDRCRKERTSRTN